jgi:hypothetical protein
MLSLKQIGQVVLPATAGLALVLVIYLLAPFILSHCILITTMLLVVGAAALVSVLRTAH